MHLLKLEVQAVNVKSVELELTFRSRLVPASRERVAALPGLHDRFNLDFVQAKPLKSQPIIAFPAKSGKSQAT